MSVNSAGRICDSSSFLFSNVYNGLARWHEFVFRFVLLAACLVLLFEGASLFVQAERLQAQETRMHEMALRHRSYEPTAQWKHDERSLLAEKKKKQVYGMTCLAFALGALLIGLFAWPVARKARLRKGRTDGTPWARRSWETETVTFKSEPENGRFSANQPVDTPSECADVLEQTPELSLAEKRSESGRRGEKEVYAALAPLLLEGWALVGRNVLMEVAGRTYGDVDFVLRGPSGVGVSLDAKNGNVLAWLHNGNVYFKHRWHKNPDGSPIQWFYPLSRAWVLADWVKERYRLATVRPVICLTELVAVRELRRTNGVDIIKVAKLCDCLRAIDTYHASNGGAVL